ncbi:DUF2478 domain-containing protein [uncultured Roseobacter sp.]|uniref:DUF2478 domain-containing protein n=1 Tax=uncultured Roseobacter sp. TaxID=114847 RepID=UPI002628435E|nr:DUF2478 domain-containing protein [uncultured Roseobacter sp.]
MKIAYTMAPARGDTDLLLCRFAQELGVRGLKSAGTVQINTECPDAGPCDMDVRVLPDGPVIRISQSLGPEAKGCRLDPDALETAVGLVRRSIRPETDCLIVNKFGKHEADGRGFRDVIADALSLGIPVVVGLNALNKSAFLDFTGGLGEELEPDIRVLIQWLERASISFDKAARADAAC